MLAWMAVIPLNQGIREGGSGSFLNLFYITLKKLTLSVNLLTFWIYSVLLIWR